MQGGLEVFGLLQGIGVLPQALGHGGVEHDVGPRDGVAGAQHPEFKLVARKGEGGGAVPVGGVLGEAGQDMYPHLPQLLFLGAVLFALFDGVQDFGQLVA